MRPILLAALLLLPVHAGEGRRLDAQLSWRPTKSSEVAKLSPAMLLKLDGRPLRIAPFTEGRSEPTLIAENREDADKVHRLTTHDNVPAWIAAQVKALSSDLGLQVTDATDALTLHGEVRRFFVLETDQYRAEVRLKISLELGGHPRWTGMAVGSALEFGRSFKVENYQEALSDALLDAWTSLFRDPEFLAALAD